jgi:uncharacterized protein (TIGR00251 family)
MNVTERDGVVRFQVRVQPRASRTEITGVHGDALKVRLTSPPVDGAANEMLLAFLADALGVPARNVAVTSGVSSRTKTIEVRGTTVPAIQRLAES